MSNSNFIPPEGNYCAHCCEKFNPAIKFKREAMVAIRTLSDPTSPDVIYMLCAICTLELGEFVEPILREDENWQAQKAEVRRIIRAARN